MARKKLREYSTKFILRNNFPIYCNGDKLNLKMIQVTPTSPSLVDLSKVADNNWLTTTKLVVKPDMLFGKRGKNGLVLLNASLDEADKFIKEKMNQPVEMGGKKGLVTHFIVEPFMPHDVEFYLSITAERECNRIAFSNCGGIEIEENWDKVGTLDVPYGEPIDSINLHTLVDSSIPSREYVIDFIKNVYKLFSELSFHFVEMNPFTLTSQGKPYPLDARGEVDECASFKCANKWMVNGEDVEFPQPFGRALFPEETFVNEIDEKTGASLKLTLLNPNGRIWAMVAGGGASVIYADTVADMGYGHELGNYGEYSGDPNEDDTYKYACTIISLATRNPDNRPRALLVGGGIANFTDVAVTFKGIIRAIKEYKDDILKANISIFVRRGGPNYQSGLTSMRDIGHELHIPIRVYGPEVNMTNIVAMAISHINGDTIIDDHHHHTTNTTNVKHTNGIHINGNGNGVIHQNGIANH